MKVFDWANSTGTYRKTAQRLWNNIVMAAW